MKFVARVEGFLVDVASGYAGDGGQLGNTEHFYYTLQSCSVRCRTAAVPHCNAAGDDALNGASIKGRVVEAVRS